MSKVFPLLFLFISLAVATREIPELYNLADDPSNDGQVFNWQRQTAQGSIDRVENERGTPQSCGTTFTHVKSLRSASADSSTTGRDILHLIGSLRT